MLGAMAANGPIDATVKAAVLRSGPALLGAALAAWAVYAMISDFNAAHTANVQAVRNRAEAQLDLCLQRNAEQREDLKTIFYDLLNHVLVSAGVVNLLDPVVDEPLPFFGPELPP